MEVGAALPVVSEFYNQAFWEAATNTGRYTYFFVMIITKSSILIRGIN
jgi:hypothetical protein